MEVDGLPSNFVFNCDEVGHSEFTDSPKKILIVPNNHTKKVALYPSNKNCMHATYIAYISPLGIACKPLLTVPKSISGAELYSSLLLESLDIVHTESLYVNTVVFQYWLTDIFIPFFRELRREKN